MSRRVLIVFLVFLFVLSPYSFSLPLENFSKAETIINCQNITVNTTWDLSGSPYIIYYDDLAIAENATLTIKPGVIVKMKQSSVVVNGRLIAQGDANNPIIFTSVNDDTRGSIDEQSTGDPQAGDWGELEVRKNGELILDNTIINYGGYNYAWLVRNKNFIKQNIALADTYPVGAVSAVGGKVNIDNSEISHNIIGIKAGDYSENENSQIPSNISIHNSKIYDNSQSGIINYGVNQIDATNNWWGNISGPYNLTTNASGIGNAVSDNVLFDPWIGKEETLKKNPVIIIPGILGSYLNDQTGEEVWPKIPSMVLDPWDLHLNKLELPEDGTPAGNSIMIPSDIFRNILNKDFFQGLITELKNNGYKDEGADANLFVFPYDWRWNLNLTAGDDPYDNLKSLNEKIEEVKQTTGSDKVDIIAHSMGGLVAKLYIKKYGQNSVDRFIDIGTPHLGAPKAFKILMYGDAMGLPVLDQARVKDISQNFSSIYQLLPSRKYFDDADSAYKSYIVDIYDYDNNGAKYNLDYDQSIEFMKNTGRNEYLLGANDSLHNVIDDYSPQSAGVKTYNIVGCGKPTIGKVYILNKEKSGSYEYGLQYIDGDGTVPLRSAEYLPAEKTYYTSGAEHAYLPSADGVRQLVISLLKDEQDSFNLDDYSDLSNDNSICSFSGIQIEYHSPIELHIYDGVNRHVGPDANGDIEMKIEGAQYDILDDNKFVFLPFEGSYKITGKATAVGSFDAYIRVIDDGEYGRTVYFNDVPLTSTSTNIQILTNSQEPVMEIDQDGDGTFESEREPDAFLDEEESQDLEKPETAINLSGELGQSEWYKSDVEVSLSAEDNEGGAGILKTEYSLNNGQNWSVYQQSFIVPQEGTTTIFYQSVDRAGNVETTKEGAIKIDKTQPTLNIQIPLDGQEFLQNDVLDVTYETGDSFSGIASSTLNLDGNILPTSTINLSLYNLGEHTLKIKAADYAGNQIESKVIFNIIEDATSIESTINDIEKLYDKGEIYKELVKKTLISELRVIKKYEEKYGKRQEKIDKQREEMFNKCTKQKSLEWCKKHLIINETVEYHLNKIHEKIVKSYYQILLNELNIFYKKKWLSKNAYGIIKKDIENLINNINL